MTSTTATLLYHTFARRRRGRSLLRTSIRVLQSVLESGLLLVPEEVRLPLLPGIDGLDQDPLVLRQIRISLTTLTHDEIWRHAELFGPVTIEFDLDSLRPLGVLPVYYIPSPSRTPAGASDIGFRIIADLQATAAALNTCDRLNRNAKDQLLATIEGLATMFYPADSLYTRDEQSRWTPYLSTDLKYFHQREWRIAAGLVHRGGRVDAPLTAAEQDRLRMIDSDFFCSPATGFDGRPKVDWCRIIRRVADRPVRNMIRAVWADERIAQFVASELRRYKMEERLQSYTPRVRRTL